MWLGNVVYSMQPWVYSAFKCEKMGCKDTKQIEILSNQALLYKTWYYLIGKLNKKPFSLTFGQFWPLGHTGQVNLTTSNFD
jgi:hypothetical protein